MTPATLISTPPGSGKTTILERVLCLLVMKFVYFGPQHLLLKEREEALRALGVEAVRRPKIEELCELPSKLEEISQTRDAGLNSKSLVCYGCTKFKDKSCRYYKTLETLGQQQAILCPHAILRFPRLVAELVPGRIVVLDEDSHQDVVPRESMTLVALQDAARSVRAAHGKAKRGSGLRRHLDQYAAFLERLAALAQQQVGSDTCRLLKRSDLPPLHEATLTPAEERLKWDLLRHATRGRRSPVAFMDRMVEAMEQEGPEDPIALLDPLDKKEEPCWVTLGYRTSFPPDAVILILDATGTKEHYEKLLRRPVVVDSGHVRHKSKIIQFVDASFSTSKLNDPEWEAALTSRVEKILEREKPSNAGLITFRKSKRLFDDLKLELGHFGATRGLNAMKDCDLGIVAGTFRPPNHATRALAALVYGATESELSHRPAKRTVHYRGQRISFYGFHDGILGEAERYLIESEMIQALGRFRYVTSKKKIFLISNYPLTRLLRGEVEARFASHDLGATVPVRKERRDKLENVEKLVKAAKSLQAEGKRVTQKETRRRAGLSRSTAGRYWDTVKKRLGASRRGKKKGGKGPT